MLTAFLLLSLHAGTLCGDETIKRPNRAEADRLLTQDREKDGWLVIAKSIARHEASSREASAKWEAEDVSARLKRGHSRLLTDDLDGAYSDYVFAFDHGLVQVPDIADMQLLLLAKAAPSIHRTIGEKRDALAARVRDGGSDGMEAAKWFLRVNALIEDLDAAIGLAVIVRSKPDCAEAREVLVQGLIHDVVNAGRPSDLPEVLPLVRDEAISWISSMQRSTCGNDDVRNVRQRAIDYGSRAFEALIRSGRGSDATVVAIGILRIDAQWTSFLGLVEVAKTSGQAARAALAGTRGELPDAARSRLDALLAAIDGQELKSMSTGNSCERGH